MVWIGLSVIVTVILVGVLAQLDKKDRGRVGKRCLFGLFGLVLILPSFVGNVPTGNVGIKTSFGKVLDDSLGEGVNVKAPWQEIVKMDVRVQKYESLDDLETSTKDMQVVKNISISVNYQLSQDKAASLYKTVGSEYRVVILEPAIQETIKSTISQYNASELVSMRSEISSVMVDGLNEKMESYGIHISSISINNFDFSTEYNASIERKAVAEQNALAAAQELEKEKIEAEKRIVIAESEKKANEMKQQSLTDNVIKEKFIEKWNGELPKVMGEGNLFDISSFLK